MWLLSEPIHRRPTPLLGLVSSWALLRSSAQVSTRFRASSWRGAMIIQGDMAQQPADSNKYLVIVRSKSLDEGLPRYLKTRFVIHWPDRASDERNQKTLLLELYDQVKAPPLGAKPV